MTSKQLSLQNFMGHLPQMDGSVWWHPSAQIIGQVSLGCNSSIWCGAVIRGDVNSISIGDRTNIQDNSVLHVSHPTPSHPDGAALFIGNDVTVGHSCILHGCHIADASLIGMGCIVMDNARIESEVLLGAGSLVPERQTLQSGYLYLGRPAKRIRPLTDEEIAYLYYSAQHYMRLAAQYHDDANRV